MEPHLNSDYARYLRMYGWLEIEAQYELKEAIFKFGEPALKPLILALMEIADTKQ